MEYNVSAYVMQELSSIQGHSCLQFSIACSSYAKQTASKHTAADHDVDRSLPPKGLASKQNMLLIIFMQTCTLKLQAGMALLLND